MSDKPTLPATSKDAALEELRGHAAKIDQDPLTNSVLRLAQDYFFAMSNDQLDVGALERLVDEVGSDVFLARAKRLTDKHQLGERTDWQACREAWTELSSEGFESFKSKIEDPRAGIVFTAHPTFAHSRRVRAQLAAAACGEPSNDTFNALEREDVTLRSEHEDAQAGIENAQLALRSYLSAVIDHAQTAFPEQWRDLNPTAPTLASWVAYDLDGRDDIRWWTSISYRLAEKAEQLARYASATQAIADADDENDASNSLKALAERLRAASGYTHLQSEQFAKDLNDPEQLVAAANMLTEPHADSLTDLTDTISELRTLSGSVSNATAKPLIVLASEMALLGLGTARIHLRINAAQIQSVIRRDLGVLTEDHQLGRVALDMLAERIKVCETSEINFADLFLEQSTARRQFMLCAQILKHIDANIPIRFLIAESENPATVLGALYLARQYGVDRDLDISPLFETPEALENGGRFIATLLDVPVFADYISARGQLSVQLGFSDAGRFIGQIAADMAIERIHNLIAQALANAMPGTRLLVFNTHGESMGRGGYPGSFKDRLDHLMTPWTRMRCAGRGIPLIEETSFQGGDGYLHFATPTLALSAFDYIAAHALQESPSDDDPFYTRTSLVWDFYRSLRGWQEALFDDKDYGVLVSGFAASFRVKAGSRPQRRSGGPAGPRSLRAISHNATLHQLAALANTAGGIGSSLRRETDELAALIDASPRMKTLIGLAINARRMTSVPALRAYATAFSPSFWVACSKRAADSRKDARIRLATGLRNRRT
ncbi:MAG: phosphoenolpyruvate carboxylase, partial [Pseudomonadota bacterium]